MAAHHPTAGYAAALALLAACLTATPAGRAADPDLILHLKFDEASGSLATDASGSGNDATVVTGAGTPTWTAGRREGGMRFAGDSAAGSRCARVSWHSGLHTPNAITVMAWVRLDQIQNALQCIAGRYTRNCYDWRLWVDKRGNHVTFKFGTGGLWQELKAPVTHGGLQTNTWYHIAATWDGSVQKVYLDAAELGSRSAGGTMQFDGTAPLGVGAKGGTSWSEHIWATIDDLKIWKRALSATEIQAEMADTARVARLRWQEGF